ncbi:YMGG-like glycine zipper-containing protein [Novosphingobium sp. MBES04]|uniref:YMGG-like glycine zipper-containing protein n=1 Tax=Novosphingobium sp. MBES04 TaxID=1206458 RepID=UPI0007232AF8|nr:YMGG-like glycine zipper-containing protein [Novosphingobium sp. MBES04]GAM06849.1 hypothetical protein MBENS4_3845 [Novosphingobium sp. MBES04]
MRAYSKLILPVMAAGAFTMAGCASNYTGEGAAAGGAVGAGIGALAGGDVGTGAAIGAAAGAAAGSQVDKDLVAIAVIVRVTDTGTTIADRACSGRGMKRAW